MLGHSKKREAIRECKRLWKAIEKSGLSKVDFLNTIDGEIFKDKNYRAGCPLCDYSMQKGIGFLTYRSKDCKKYCPLIEQYGHGCIALGYGENSSWIPTKKWLDKIYGLKE
jgi:hypothetical protein